MQNFHQPGHRLWCFLLCTLTTCQLFEKRRREFLSTAVVVSHGATVAISYNINRHKISRYTWYLSNFDRPLGLCGHRWRCFWCRHRVISLKMMERVRGNCCLPLVMEHVITFSISRNIPNFACSFRHLFCVAASRISHFHNTNMHHQKGLQWRSRSCHLQP